MKEKATEPPVQTAEVTKRNRAVKSAAREAAYIALCISFISVCAWISIPLGTIPVTLQTLAVPLIAALMGWKRSLAAVAIYFVMGLIGIPVFSGFRAGVVVLLGPTGGYLLGFLLDVILVGAAKYLPVKNKKARFGILYAAMIVGAVCYFAFGTLWFMTVYSGAGEMGLTAALMLCVVPYLLPDAVKAALAAYLAIKLERFVK